MKTSIRLNEENALAIERHAKKSRRSFNSQGNIAVEDWLTLPQNRLAKLKKICNKSKA